MPATIDPNGMKVLETRYLEGESVDFMWDRVSGGNPKFRRLLEELEFLPNSPTLFNAGRPRGGTLSACFVFNVADSMLDGNDSIVATRAKAIAVAKAGGGVGYYLGDLRARGAAIRSVQRVACGPCGVLRDYQQIQALITQGGKRDLAQMAVLPSWHDDILEFIHVKDADPQAFNSFNISVSWEDDALAKSLDPDSREGRVWREQIDSAWKHGCPGVFLHTRCNRPGDGNPNPHLGLIKATNPCGETGNRSDEPCNLGSLNVAKFFDPGNRSVNWDRLAAAAYTATEFLDDILDRNVFPHPDITKAALLTRKLGLGVMGWADLLTLMHVHYDTEEAVDLARVVMKTIWEAAFEASLDMVTAKGPYQGYSPNKTEGEQLRNETRTSIAPTGTISLIAGASSGIEPHYALEWQRTTKEGIVLKERIPVWDRLEGFVPKTAHEIAPEWHVRHQAAFQEFTDLGVSKTVNLPNSATREDVDRVYRLMHELGCKGGTVFRDGCRDEQVLVKKKDVSVFTTGKEGAPPAETPKKPRKVPRERPAVVHKFRVAETTAFLTVGLYEDGTPAEVFLRVSKCGSTVSGMLDSWAIALSLAIQNGTPLESLLSHFMGQRFEPCGVTDNPELPLCTSIQDYVARWLEKKFIKKDAKAVVSYQTVVNGDTPVGLTVPNGKIRSKSGQLCPECGTEAIYQSGCLTCPSSGCGWNRCG